MKLSDVVGNAGLAFYTEVALVVFFVVFVAVVVRTWRPSRRRELEAQRLLPLEPDSPAPPREGAES
jgi:cbb3-type cytochrome oxidase subunit 3